MSFVDSHLERYDASPQQRLGLQQKHQGQRALARLSLKGSLDVACLQRAATVLVTRHEVLRTSLSWFEGELVQVVGRESAFVFEELPADTDARQQAAAEVSRDPNHGPPLRLLLQKPAEGDRQLWVSLPASCCDGLSLELLIAELGTLYGTLQAMNEPPPETGIQYRQYSAYLTELAEDEDAAEGLRFWQARCREQVAAASLPFERSNSWQAAVLYHNLDAAATARMEDTGEVQALLLACWSTLLARLVGGSVSRLWANLDGRSFASLDQAVGPLSRYLPLTLEPTAAAGTTALITTILDLLEEGADWQDYFDQAIGSQLEGSLGFAYLVAGTADWGSLSVTVQETWHLDAPFKLALKVRHGETGLQLGFYYDAGCIEAADAARWAQCLLDLLDAATTRTERAPGLLPLLAGHNLERVLRGHNQTRVDWKDPRAAHQFFEALADHRPDDPALIFQGEHLTYGELNLRANRLAGDLHAAGIGRDALVGVFLKRGFEMVISLLAIHKAGAAYVPLDPEYPSDRLAYMIEAGELTLILSCRQLADQLPRTKARVWQVADHLRTGNSSNLALTVEPLQAAYTIFTSGSTGRPKPILISHGAIANRLLWMQSAYGLTAADRVLQKTPFSFDVSVWEFFWPLMTGATLVIARPGGHQDPRYLSSLIEREGITTLHFVPSMLRLFLDTAAACSSLRRVFSSGEALPRDLAWRFLDKLPQVDLHNLYGPTEAAVEVTAWPCRRETIAAGVPIGTPIANTRIHIVSPHMQPLPEGLAGELYIGGANLARGYHGRGGLTAERFIPDPFAAEPGARLYRSGDLARYRGDGAVEYLGRMDFQLKLRGFRIELGEIEERLRAHLTVADAVVCARDHEGDTRLVAYVVADSSHAAPADREACQSELDEFLALDLPEYMLPASYVFLTDMPLFANGKVDRKALPDPAASNSNLSAYTTPEGETESALAGIWAEMLGLERVSAEDSFFALGGHSLSGTVMSFRAEAQLNRTFTLQDLYAHPSIRELARYIDETASTAGPVAAPIPKLERLDGPQRFPLSFAQQRLWFIDRFQPDSPGYNLVSAVRLSGPLDGDALERAFDEIVRRHEVLRTTYAVREDVQMVSPFEPVPLSLVDLSDHDGAEAAVQAMLAGEARTPFNIHEGPILRRHLLRLAQDHHILVWNLHHIASDGWSAQILVRELTSLYASFKAGRPSTLAPPRIQYADYAVWQRSELTQTVLADQESWWFETLASVATLALPTDSPRPKHQSFAGARVPIRLGTDLSAGLRRLAKKHDTTLFTTLLAGFTLLLARYSGQRDIVIGAPLANRPKRDLEPLIGFFINTLPLRIQINPDADFATLLAAVKHTVSGAQANQDLPFERLVDLLALERDPSRTPIYQVVLNFGNQGNPRPDGDLQVTPLETDTGTSKFDLTLNLSDSAEGLVGSFDYNPELFGAARMKRLARHLENLLGQAAASNPLAVMQLPLLAVDEWKQMVSGDFGRGRPKTAAPFPEANIHGLFESMVCRHGTREALCFEETRLSYTELNGRANQLAHYLISMGVGPESHVGLFLERSSDWVTAILAVLKSGAIYVPLDPSYPQERVDFIARDAEMTIILTEPSLTDRISSELAICLDWASLAQWDSANPDIVVQADSGAYIIYTSGSTGKPKGVVIPHANVLRLFSSSGQWFSFSERDCWTLFHSYAFDFSVWEIWGALFFGGRLVVVPYMVSRSPDDFYGLLCREKVTVLNQSPSAFRQLVQLKDGACAQTNSLRYVVFGAEALDVKSLEPWFDRFGETSPVLVNMYGITETTVHVTWRPVSRADAGSGYSPIGVGIPDLNLFLLDSEYAPVPVGVAGEIYVGGAGLARGYLKRPDLTAERFVPCPFGLEDGRRLYKSGDMARVGEDGQLVFLGRNDDQVKIRGFRIEPGEVQAELVTCEEVAQAVVLPRTDSHGRLELVAYVIAEPAANLDKATLRDFLGTRLPAYMVPSRFFFLDLFPMTAHGKLDRGVLKAIVEEGEQQNKRYLAPETKTELALAAIWAEVLAVAHVGADDNYFALGGDSILSVRIMGLAQERGLCFSLQQHFAAATLADLAEEIDGSGDGAAAAAPSQPFELVSEQVLPNLPEDVVDAYPMSRLQLGMIYHMELDPEILPYHNVTSYHLRGAIHREAFCTAVEMTVARHAIFRTSFHLAGYGAPLQLVHRQAQIQVIFEDLSALSPKDADAAFDAHMACERARPFDLTRPGLIRFAFHFLGNDEFRFSLTECHPILDGWSLNSALAEIISLHFKLAKGEGSTPVPAPAVTYRDFIKLEVEALASAEFKQFWKTHLTGFARTRPVPWAGSGEHPGFQQAKWVMSPQEAWSLQSFAKHARVPFKSVLMAAHIKVMSLLTGQNDIITGMQVNGRPESGGGDQALGLFLNTMPFRLVLQSGTWGDLVRQVYKEEADCLPYRRYPVAAIQEAHGKEPIYETGFNHVHFHARKDIFKTNEIEIAGQGKNEEPTHFPFSANLVLNPENGSLSVVLHSTATYPAEQLKAMLAYYAEVFAAIQEPQKAHLDHLTQSLLPALERERLLVTWNDTDKPCEDRRIFMLIEEQARFRPAAVAVTLVGEGKARRTLTYAVLNQRANQLARYLCRHGVGPEVTVGIYLERSPESIIAILAVLKAGGAYLAIDLDYPVRRVAQMAANAGIEVLVTQTSRADDFPHPVARVVCLDGESETIAAQPANNPAIEPPALCPAYLIYTPGSTGKPKGVVVSHHSLMYATQARLDNYGDHKSFLLLSPLSFDSSVAGVFGTLASGGTLVIVTEGMQRDHDFLAATIQAESVKMLLCLPSLYNLLRAHQERVVGLERVIVAREPCPEHLIDTPCALINEYGSTEATVKDLTARPVTIGRPIDNTRIYILDDFMRPVAQGAPGELYIGGEGLARGYQQAPELTAAVFLPNPFSAKAGERLYASGDLARYQPNGDIELLGRVCHQVKIRGFRIEPGEIESALREHNQIDEAVVVGRRHLGGEQLVAYLSGSLDGENLATGMRKFLHDKVPDYMVPSYFVALDALPRTANGKLDRDQLPDPSEAVLERGALVEPRTPTEALMADTWSRLLDIERISVTDDFFAIGGHSLLATQLISRLRQLFKLDIPIRYLFDEPTIAGLARLIEARQREAAGFELVAITPVSREQPLALSYAQRRLWFLQSYDPEAGTYNLPVVLHLEGDLDSAALQASLDALVVRHESLRTTFAELDNEPVALVGEPWSVALVQTDLSELDVSSREAAARDYVDAQIQAPFSLADGPLLCAHLIRLSESRHIFLLNMHHIISDGWSMGVLTREVSALYRGYKLAKPVSLPALDIQYGDFAVWQQDWLSGDVLEVQLAYWRDELSGAPPLLDLPTDFPRPKEQTFNGAVYPFELDPSLSRQLCDLARAEGVTSFMLMLAAFKVLLGRISGAEDLCVGIPIANRNREQIEGLVGFFVNTLALRTRPLPGRGFRDYLAEVRETSLAAYAHQDLPFELLVDKLQPNRELKINPFFQVVFTYVSETVTHVPDLEGLRVSGYHFEQKTAKFDLTLGMSEKAGRMSANFEYNTDLFEEATIANLAGYFQTLSAGICADPSLPLAQLPLLEPAEIQRYVYQFNETSLPYPTTKTVQEIFETWVEEDADAECLTWMAGSRSRAELNERANRIACYLRTQGVSNGDRVGVSLTDKSHLATALLGILKAGACYVPLDPAYPAERLSFMIADTAMKAWLTERHHLDLAAEVENKPSVLMLLDDPEAPWHNSSAVNPRIYPPAQSPAYIIYTSGTTGKPKGVSVSHRNIMRLVYDTRYLSFEAGDGLAQISNTSFDALTFEVWTALLLGGRLCLVDRADIFDPAALEASVRALRINTMFITTMLFNRIAADRPHLFKLFKTLLFGGELASPKSVVSALDAGGPDRLLHVYGPTECTTFSTWHLLTAADGRGFNLPIGRPIANSQSYVLDAHLSPAPAGVPGELYLGGDGLASGYHNRPDLTADRFVPNPFVEGRRLYRSGDRVVMLADGGITFLERIDRQVKIRGFRIEPGEIEACLRTHTLVKEVVVPVVVRADGERALAVYVTTKDDQLPESGELRAHLEARLPAYMVPADYRVLEQFPMTPNGKVDTQALPEPGDSLEMAEIQKPRTETEALVIDIFLEMLGKKLLSVESNFFTAGGHSLMAARVISRLHDSLAVRLPLRVLFEKPTAVALAAYIDFARDQSRRDQDASEADGFDEEGEI